ncbi:MAG TPA: 5-formyltetrahydrofolate cyclo-ligase [Kofleriaceae bacterium]|nr:5-formyltetrahydrofolate cyclo-ligase [Kofleriaceae bacterium]
MSTPSSPRSSKPVTRKAVLALRDGLTDERRAEASARIAERTTELLADRHVVALYAPKGSEVDTRAIDENLRARGARVVYPRIVDDQRELAFHEVPPDKLVASRYGLYEPRADWRNQVGLVEIDAFVVPGVAFDRRGGRLGFGRGHYDATLTAAPPRALRIGLAFEAQLVDDVHHEAHDVALHVIVTEAASYR